MKEKNELIGVFTGTEVAVVLLKGRLEMRGISCIIKKDSNAVFLGVVPSTIELFIQQCDLKKAEPILSEFIKNNKI